MMVVVWVGVVVWRWWSGDGGVGAFRLAGAGRAGLHLWELAAHAHFPLPPTAQPCTLDDLQPLPELQARIEAWVAEQRVKRRRRSSGGTGDGMQADE